MSSRKFKCVLLPDRKLNRLLQLLAALSSALGLLLILQLPVDALLRGCGALAWCFLSGRELADIATSHKRYSGLRLFADGGVEIRNTAAQWQAASLQRGCLVLARLAWFDLRLEDGRRWRLLLRGDARESKQWRRLQVIWRHLGTTGRSC